MTYRSLAALAALLVSLPQPAFAADAKAAIAAQYHRADFAFDRNDLDGAFASQAPNWYLIDQTGRRLSLEQARAAVRYLWRPVPGRTSATWRALTDTDAVQVSGNRATASGHAQVELVTVDRNGTVADVHQTSTFQDDWARTPAGWRLQRSHVLQAKRSVSAHVSAYLMGQLAHMREMNAEMREFNSAINFSNCIYSDGMQKFDYWERQQRCQ